MLLVLPRLDLFEGPCRFPSCFFVGKGLGETWDSSLCLVTKASKCVSGAFSYVIVCIPQALYQYRYAKIRSPPDVAKSPQQITERLQVVLPGKQRGDAVFG